uniref:Zinc finger PMZ-type domain-containing protein n=1 Tax=Tanacetum cinerariifolium TaxID=118510 RepID=A0A699HU79_TANCI|nr:hypothetical protein [Tanacetum cinerariifolium]
MCKAYIVEDFGMAINELGSKRPDVYKKLIEAGVERWSRAYYPRDRYNYMTSNSVELINNLTRDVRKVLITNLMKWYRKLVQRWYYERQEKYKGNGTYTCRKWQVSGLPCGYVLAICRVIRLTDCNHLAKGWFMRIALKGTYQELVYPMGEVSSWQIPNYMTIVKPSHIDKNHLVDQRARNVLDLKVRNLLQSDVEGAGRVVITDKGVRKPFHTQKKGYILEEAHSKQMTTYRNQCRGPLMLSTWMTLDAAYFMFLNEWKDNNRSYTKGNSVGNKMYKAFPLPGESSHWQ